MTAEAETEPVTAVRPAASRRPGALLYRLGPARTMIVVGMFAALVFYLVNALHYGQLPLRIEENEWPPMAAAIIDHGKPVIAADETHRLRFTSPTTTDQSPIIGAWHPPLYLYSVAASMLVLGDDASYSLRIIGVAGWLLTCMLVLLVARRLERKRWLQVGGAAVILLLIAPYTVQGSLFLDIDTQIYAPLILGYLYALLLFVERPERLTGRQLSLLVLLLTTVLWAKMTTAISLVVVTTVCWVWLRGWRRGGREMGIVLVGTAALFLCSYALWSHLAGIPFSYTFDVTFAKKSGRLLGSSLLRDGAVSWHTAWLTPGFLALVGVFGVGVLVNLVRGRRLRPVDMLWAFGVAVLVNYVLLSPTDGSYQGKYVFTAIAPLMLCITWMLLRRPMPAAPWAFGAAVLIGIAAALVVPDLLTNGTYWLSSNDWRRNVVLVSILILLTAWLLVRVGTRGFGAGVLIVLGALFLGQSVRSYDANTSPLYPVKDTAEFRAAGALLKRIVGRDRIALVPKDLGFSLSSPVMEGEVAFARGDALEAAVLRTNKDVVVYAHDSFGPPIGPLAQAVIESCFEEQPPMGTVTIHVRRATCIQAPPG